MATEDPGLRPRTAPVGRRRDGPADVGGQCDGLAGKHQLTPTEATRLARHHVVNPDAHLEYFKGGIQRGGIARRRRTRPSSRAAALDIDPEFAAAWSALADCHMTRRARHTRLDGGCRTALPARRSALHISSRRPASWRKRGSCWTTSRRRECSVSCRPGESAPCTSLRGIDEAYRWLELAVQEKASGLILLRASSTGSDFESDARYWPLVRRVGLDDARSRIAR